MTDAVTTSQASPPDWRFPDHDGGAFQPAASRVITEWPAPSFAENLAVAADGTIYVTLHTHARIDRVDPRTGHCAPAHQFDVPIAGLAFDTAEHLWITGGTPGQAPGHIWRLSPDGTLEPWTTIDEALFLNGATVLGQRGPLLVCDSLKGCIFAVDRQRPGRASVWLSDDRLTPRTPGAPGANGIKTEGGQVWISVTERNLLLTAALDAVGTPGSLGIYAAQLRIDDFALRADHTLFGATHPANSVIRLDPDGTRTTLVGPAQGAVGATACAFGRTEADRTALYVTTNGGLWSPWQGQVQSSKLLRVETAGG